LEKRQRRTTIGEMEYAGGKRLLNSRERSVYSMTILTPLAFVLL